MAECDDIGFTSLLEPDGRDGPWRRSPRSAIVLDAQRGSRGDGLVEKFPPEGPPGLTGVVDWIGISISPGEKSPSSWSQRPLTRSESQCAVQSPPIETEVIGQGLQAMMRSSGSAAC